MKKFSPIIPLVLLLANGVALAGSPEFFVFDNGVGRGKWTPEKQAATLKELGYDGISYNYTNLADLAVWLKTFKTHGLKIYALYVHAFPDKEPPYDANLKEAIRMLKGEGTIIWLTLREVKDKKRNYDAECVQIVRDLAGQAAANGLRVALYPHAGFYVACAADSVRIAKQVDRPNVGATFNLCHEFLTRNGDKLDETIKLAAPVSLLVSINGMDVEAKHYFGRLDQGNFGIAGLLKKLHAAGYKGPIGWQGYNVPGDPRENLRLTMEAWKKLMSQSSVVRGPLLTKNQPRTTDDGPKTKDEIDSATLDKWSAPYRGWHYWPKHVVPARPDIPGQMGIIGTDVPTVYQVPGDKKWYMSFVGFNGKGYQSFVAESDDLLRWQNYRLAMGFGPAKEFDHGGCVIGAFLYESYDVKAPRLLKKRDGKYWTLYGAYPRQGGYELRPGYEGVASSDDGLTWQRAKQQPILSVFDVDCGPWEKDCIYQPWLVEHQGRFVNFYNAARGGVEQLGMAFSEDLLTWKRHPGNPVLRNRPGGYDAQFCSDAKVFRDGDHWTMIYFGVGKGGAHIMVAFSRDLIHWTAHPEPLYKAGGNPSGLDKRYAHKVTLVWNPFNETYYLFYNAVPGTNDATGGRGIGLITSKPLPPPQ